MSKQGRAGRRMSTRHNSPPPPRRRLPGDVREDEGCTKEESPKSQWIRRNDEWHEIKSRSKLARPQASTNVSQSHQRSTTNDHNVWQFPV